MRFGALDRVCAGQKSILLAVSGGSDSLALMHLTAAWAKDRSVSVHVATVDHGLRADSDEEADFVKASASALDLPHQTHKWTEPEARQAAARDARLRLLADAARDVGAHHILMGHTLDDVCETILMRRRRGAEEHHLAGPSFLAPHPFWPLGRDLTVVRPLITTMREDLRKYLNKTGVQWIDDPSNENAKFERVRVRQFLSRHPRLRHRMFQMADRFLEYRARFDARIGQVLAQPEIAHVDVTGMITLDASRVPDEVSPDTLSMLIRIAAGDDRLPDRAALKRLPALDGRTTLGGAWIEKRGTDFRLGRDPGEANLVERDGLWDGRYERAPHVDEIETYPFLLRQSAPQGEGWREIISERVAHTADILKRSEVPDAVFESMTDIELA